MGGDGRSALDICLYTDRLRFELVRQLESRDKLEGDLHKIVKEKSFLDDQLHDTITSYTGMIQDLQEQVSHSQALGSAGAAPACHGSHSA